MSDQLRIKQTSEFSNVSSLAHGQTLTYDAENSSFTNIIPQIFPIAMGQDWPSGQVIPENSVFGINGLFFIVTSGSGYNPDANGDGQITTSDLLLWLTAAGGTSIDKWPLVSTSAAGTVNYQYVGENTTAPEQGEFSIRSVSGVWYIYVNGASGQGSDLSGAIWDQMASNGGSFTLKTQATSGATATTDYMAIVTGTTNGAVTSTGTYGKVYRFILNAAIEPHASGDLLLYTALGQVWNDVTSGDGFTLEAHTINPNNGSGGVIPTGGMPPPPNLGDYEYDTSTTSEPGGDEIDQGAIILSTANTSLTVGSSITIYMSDQDADDNSKDTTLSV